MAREQVESTPFCGNLIFNIMCALRMSRMRARNVSESRGMAMPKGFVMTLKLHVSSSMPNCFVCAFLSA